MNFNKSEIFLGNTEYENTHLHKLLKNRKFNKAKKFCDNHNASISKVIKLMSLKRKFKGFEEDYKSNKSKIKAILSSHNYDDILRFTNKKVKLGVISKQAYKILELPCNQRTDKLKLAAIKNDGQVFSHFESVSYKVCLAAVKDYSSNLEFVPSSLQNDEIQLAAINGNEDIGFDFSFFYKPSDKVCFEALTKDSDCIKQFGDVRGNDSHSKRVEMVKFAIDKSIKFKGVIPLIGIFLNELYIYNDEIVMYYLSKKNSSISLICS